MESPLESEREILDIKVCFFKHVEKDFLATFDVKQVYVLT